MSLSQAMAWAEQFSGQLVTFAIQLRNFPIKAQKFEVIQWGLFWLESWLTPILHTNQEQTLFS